MDATDLAAAFAAAAERATQLPVRPDPATLLRLYGLFKQARSGDAAAAAPALTDPVGRAKHAAWAGLRGMPADAAMRAYIALVDRLAGRG
ncbi:MAG: acyl-CoA-binding protein [Chloroflexi bacterium]|nr:acyl-CoA-binding protein [Chloroflexota bacterium]